MLLFPALDEYVSEIFMGGRNVIAMHNTCEDSLLASPLIIDLCILAELQTRISYKVPGHVSCEWISLVAANSLSPARSLRSRFTV